MVLVAEDGLNISGAALGVECVHGGEVKSNDSPLCNLNVSLKRFSLGFGDVSKPHHNAASEIAFNGPHVSILCRNVRRYEFRSHGTKRHV